mgnify:CR=1 FL=1
MAKNLRYTGTLTEISRRSGFSLAHISKIFSGGRFPSFRAAAKIARAKGVTLDELYEEIVALNGPYSPNGIDKRRAA